MMETKEERKQCVLVWDTACDDVVHYMCAALHYLVPRLICNSLLSVRLRPSAIITSLQLGLCLQQMDFPIITITIVVSVIPLFSTRLKDLFSSGEEHLNHPLRRWDGLERSSKITWNMMLFEKKIYIFLPLFLHEGRRSHSSGCTSFYGSRFPWWTFFFVKVIVDGDFAIV